MGASGWEYVVPYQQDLGAALDALRPSVSSQVMLVRFGLDSP